MDRNAKRVALIHQIDGGNLGEDATATAIKDGIQLRWPEAEIVGLAMVRQDPRTTIKWPISHKTNDSSEVTSNGQASLKARVKALLPRTSMGFRVLRAAYGLIRQPMAVIKELLFLAKAFQTIRSCKIVVISAGDQFLEELGHHRVFRDSTWKYSYTIFKWALLARMAGAKVILLNLSSGRRSGLAKVFVRLSLRLANTLSFRDEESQAALLSAVSRSKGLVLPDPAYALNISAGRLAANANGAKPVVGISPMILGDPSPRLESFLHQMSDFAEWLQSTGYHPRLFCSHINVDSAALCGMQEIVAARNGLPDASSCLDRVHQWSTEELIANMVPLDFVLTSRLHAVVFAQLLGKPVIAVSNHGAVKSLMKESGLSQYCLSIDSCNQRALREAFTSLVRNRDNVIDQMAKYVAASRQNLEDGFDQLFPPKTRKGQPEAEVQGVLAD